MENTFPWRRWLAAAPFAYAVWQLVALGLARWQDPTPPAIFRLESPADFVAACRWIDEHTPPKTVCLVPRYAQAFHWYARRANAGNWKDAPQDSAGVLAWKRRIDDLFPDVGAVVEPWILAEPSQLGGDRVRALAAKYGATFVLTAAEPPLDLPRAWPKQDADIDYYAVYDLTPAQRQRKPDSQQQGEAPAKPPK